ncbi:MAG: site-specific integrase [Lachnospiraceae bacterium]|nr:site-specific integrase [Lachnospiraceae bacterium]
MAKRNDIGIFQMDNGRWGYRITQNINGKSKDIRRVRDEDGNPFMTKTSAIIGKQKAIAQLEEKRQPKTQRKTFGDVYEEYCEKGRSKKAHETNRKYDSLWRNHIREKFADKYIDEISVAEVNDYLADLYYVDGFAFGYVEGFLKMFYLVFGQAYTRNYLDLETYSKLCLNRGSKITIPKRKSSDIKGIIIYSKEELDILDKYFVGKNSETAYMLGRYCGLRINEAYGLKWSNVDLDKGTILIDRQLQYINGLLRLGGPKTSNANRTIYMNDKLTDYLTDLKFEIDNASKRKEEVRKQNQIFLKDIDNNTISSLELVNTLMDGRIQTRYSIKYHADQIRKLYGFDFKFHYLRHTYGTLLAEMNTPSHILCAQLGHASIRATQMYYLGQSTSGIDILKTNIEQL